MNDSNNTTEIITTNVSINSNTILNSTAEQTDLHAFMDNFPVNSTSFSRPSPSPPLRSHKLGRVSRIDQIRQHSRARERAVKTRFVAARINTRKEVHAQLLETLKGCRLSKSAKVQLTQSWDFWTLTAEKLYCQDEERHCGPPRTLSTWIY